MQSMIIGVFAALDSMLFYVFWEAMLIPMYLAIGVWGSQNRNYAAIKFFLYTFLGSAFNVGSDFCTFAHMLEVFTSPIFIA